MKATLYAMPASHPSMAAALMLERKGIAHRVVWLLLPFTGPILRLAGFAGRTVPALRLDRRRIQGSRAISSALARIHPEPALFPRDPTRRDEVEEAERWGDDVLQPAARRIEVSQLRRDREPRAAGRLGPDPGSTAAHHPRLAAATGAPTLAWYARLIGAKDEAVPARPRRAPLAGHRGLTLSRRPSLAAGEAPTRRPRPCRPSSPPSARSSRSSAGSSHPS